MEAQWNVSDMSYRFLEEENDIGSNEPSAAPTDSAEFVTSTDGAIIRETFRVYGSVYLLCFTFFCFARKYFPRYFNIRGWVPEMESSLAKSQEYGFVAWCWQVFKVSDDKLLEHCGMDALCYLRCLRMGANLSLVGIFCAAFLVPLYMTAEESEETAYLTDIFVKMSIANLPINSKRFLGSVVAIYCVVLYSMHLVRKEYDWFTEYRHKFLSQRVPRNYACYVSGIPAEYRSSYALADYFRRCSSNTAVLEAHIAVSTPSLDAKIARREKIVGKLEHTMALERKKGRKLTHRTFNFEDGVGGVRKVDSVDAYRSELTDLNKKIALEIGEIRNTNHPLRKHLVRGQGSSDVSRVSSDVGHDNMSESSQPQHLEIRFGKLKEIEDRRRDERPFVSNEARRGLGRSELSAAEISYPGTLDTISEMAEAASVHTERSARPVPVRSGSSFSAMPDDDIPHHPFLNMFGLDASFFEQNYAEVTRKLTVSASNSELTPSIAQTRDDETVSESGQADSNDTHSYSTNSLDSEDESSQSSGDIEEGRLSGPDSPSHRMGSRGPSWAYARSNMANIHQSIRRVGELGAQGSKSVGSRVRNVVKDVNRETVSASIKKVGNVGAHSIKTASSIGALGVKKAAQTIQSAPDLGASLATSAAESAAAVVPVLLKKNDGDPREAGFVVFNDLYSTQAARQMLHHPSVSRMTVEPAGSPEEIFWRNVGLPAKAKRAGRLLSLVATTFLCFFWSIPSAFLSSLTEINSLKEKLPLLGDLIERAPRIEQFLALIAPLLLLLLNECVLPSILKWFAAWEGHVSSPVLEASLFTKLAAFTMIQTFFVSTISGTISAEISNILDNPEQIVDLLANSLPAQSSYFIQVCFVFTFFLQGMDLVRAYPLGVAFLRNYFFGPRLTAKERRKTWKIFNSLEDPPEFWHAEILAQIMLFFVVFFVYAVIAPITSVFLFSCFAICESGYRYHFIHNNHTHPDSGGRLWQGFIQVLMASMLIGELTLVGLLILKKTVYALAALAPLIAMTVLFMIFVIPKRNHVARHLPTMLCAEIDAKHALEASNHAGFASMKYLQPSLRAQPMYAEEEHS